jgi:elongation factor Ts
MRLPDDPSRTLADYWTDAVNRMRENMQIAKVGALTGQVGSYVHHNAQVGVLIEVSAACPDSAKTDVCMHIAAMRPPYVNRDQVPAADVERERAAAREAAKGKPAPVVEKIVSGKLDRWFSEFVLLEQPFVKDDKQSVSAFLNQVAKGLTVRRFLRYEVGVG